MGSESQRRVVPNLNDKPVPNQVDILRYSTIKAAELALLESDVRGDAERVRRLLAPDFAEIGASGRRWTAEEITGALSNEAPRAAPETSDWLFNELSADLVLVNYRLVTPERVTRRASIWQITDDGPTIRFHQGTVVHDA